jgi:hypothetical protein
MHSFRHSGEACAGLDPVAGIQCSPALTNSWTPFFNGVTAFYEIINLSRHQTLTPIPYFIDPSYETYSKMNIELARGGAGS